MPATLTTTALDSSGLGRRLIAGSKGPPRLSCRSTARVAVGVFPADAVGECESPIRRLTFVRRTHGSTWICVVRFTCTSSSR
jgi:hypothetical protein